MKNKIHSSECAFHVALRSDIALNKLNFVAVRIQHLATAAHEIIQDSDLRASLQERVDRMQAHETSAAGYQKSFHKRALKEKNVAVGIKLTQRVPGVQNKSGMLDNQGVIKNIMICQDHHALLFF